MIRHVVMWKFKPQAEGQAGRSNALVVKGLLESLQGKVPEIHNLAVGINCLPDETNYHLVLSIDFADLAALERYQKHPAHVQVVPQIARLVAARSAVDYEF